MPADPRVLVGFDTADDAGVYRVSDDRAIVLTVDIITPIVDDAHTFGRVAATNAISDVYAMGGRPLAALNICCFSPKLPAHVYQELLRGANEVALAAGCPIVGGHTIKDDEIKFGLAVVGEVHPDRILRNSGAKVGDSLILTKPLGTAALATAFKRGELVEDDPAYATMVASMTHSNGPAADVAGNHGVNAMTDVTGFGLSGHGLELALGSNVSLRLEFDALPKLDRAVELLGQGHTCGGGNANQKRTSGKMKFERELSEEERHLLHDPQTSGPLLISLPEDRSADAVQELQEAGYAQAAVVGTVVTKGDSPLIIC